LAAERARLAKLDRRGVARLREEQRDFNIKRDGSFSSPDYQLKREARLLALRGFASEN
jgi:hypothetical protein